MSFTFATNCWPPYPDWPVTLAYCVPLFLLPLLFSEPVPSKLRLLRLSFAPVLLCSASGFQGFRNMLGSLTPQTERNIAFVGDSLILLRTPFLIGLGLFIVYSGVSLSVFHLRRRHATEHSADASSRPGVIERIVITIPAIVLIVYAVLLLLPIHYYNHSAYAVPESHARVCLAFLTMGCLALALLLMLPLPCRRSRPSRHRRSIQA